MKNLLLVVAVFLGIVSVACSEDEPAFSFSDITLNSFDHYSLPCGEDVVWETSNSYIATVSGNQVNSFCAGTATLSSDLGSFKVTVVPVINSFVEPYIEWGASMQAVKDAMKEYRVVESSHPAVLAFHGRSAVDYYAYHFEGSRLDESLCVIKASDLPAYNVAAFILERYYPHFAYDGIYFLSTDNKTYVTVADAVVDDYPVYYIIYGDFSAYVDSVSSSTEEAIRSGIKRLQSKSAFKTFLPALHPLE